MQAANLLKQSRLAARTNQTLGSDMKAAGFTKTLLLVSGVLFFALPHSGGIALVGSFVSVAVVAIFLPWAIYSLVRIAIRPAERRGRATSLAIWVITVALLFAAQAHWDAAAREEVNVAVSAIESFKSRTGSYPENLSELGIDAHALKEKFSLSYRLDDGKAALFYSQPSMPMVAHHYDFQTHSWGRRD